jgi:peptide chain release factor 2
VKELDLEASTPEFWADPARAQQVQREKGGIERVVRDWDAVATLRDEIATLLELAEEADDVETAREAAAGIDRLEGALHRLETARLLAEEQDRMDAILEIHPGAGGTDAQDWAEMLLRMYTRWAEQGGYTTELLDLQPAEEAGIKSASLAVRGPNAFGFLQAESGVHRLVRISPFDANSRRQTAFAAVHAIPEVDDDIEVDLNPADVEMQTMRASGAGGQHVNTTDSAVRLIHGPTGIVVLCRAERSQHKNRDKAMKMLRAKLYELELNKRLEAQAEKNAKKKKIDFGSQIRSYVLQPYQQVKDLRTGFTTSNVDAVLGGGIDAFMEAWLVARADGTLDDAAAEGS